MRRYVTEQRQHLEISDSNSFTLILRRHIQHFQLQDTEVQRKPNPTPKNQAAVYFPMRPKHGLGNKKENTKSHSCCVQSAAQRPLHPRIAIGEHDPAHLWVTKQLDTPIPSYDGFENIYLHFKDGAFS